MATPNIPIKQTNFWDCAMGCTSGYPDKVFADDFCSSLEDMCRTGGGANALMPCSRAECAMLYGEIDGMYAGPYDKKALGQQH